MELIVDPAFAPIPAFGGGNLFSFEAAYNWNATRILQFLKDVSENPKVYWAPEGDKQIFQLLYKEIYALRFPDGNKYSTPAPAQQFLRKNQGRRQLDPTNNIPWGVNNKSEKFYIIFDLLGVFLSLMGPAKTSSKEAPNEKNFFLPLVVVYTRWCGKLAAKPNQPVNPQSPGSPKCTPAAAQVTWSREGDGKPWDFFLGTSIAGWGENAGSWKFIVKSTRHDYLKARNILQRPFTEYDQSPLITRNGVVAGTRYGNCGETYPFLYVLADPKLRNSSYGIAVNIAGIENENRANYDGQHYWVDWRKFLKVPCENCEQLLDWFGIKDRLRCFKLWV